MPFISASILEEITFNKLKEKQEQLTFTQPLASQRVTKWVQCV